MHLVEGQLPDMRPVARALILSFVLAIFGTAPVGSTGSKIGEVTIAIREDAAPFSWSEELDGEAVYHGFFWKICLRAIKRANYQHRVIPINAKGREELLNSGGSAATDTENVNLLCDPTTITLARLEKFDDLEGGASQLEFSPIVFIANGSYVYSRRPPTVAERKPGTSVEQFCRDQQKKLEDQRNGSVAEQHEPQDDNTLNARLKELLAASEWVVPRFRLDRPPRHENPTSFEVWGYVRGSTIGDSVEQAISRVNDDRVICPVVAGSHAEAARMFCDRLLHRYFGDVELIKAALAKHRSETGSRCPADLSQTGEGTYEPYAFVLSSANGRSEFPERFSRELYAMFEDGTIDRLFRRHFTDSPKSEYLDILFRINSIPHGRE